MGDKGGKKGKSLVKEQVQMTHWNGQQDGDSLCVRRWERENNRGKSRQL